MNLQEIRAIRSDLYDEVLGRNYVPRGESIQSGKALRKDCPRSGLGQWKVQTGRTDAVALILSEEKDRIPELLPVRHQRMAASPFAFYRASASLMAHDLSGSPRTGITVQTCGDAGP